MSEREEQKPIYKKWWVWLIAFLLFGVFIGATSDEPGEAINENNNVNEKVNNNKENNSNDNVNDINENNDENDEKEQVIEVNEVIEFEHGNLNIELQNVYIEDDKLIFGFWWNHWASNDKVHFSYFAYPVVKQDGQELSQEDKGDTLLRQTDKGVDSRVDLEYKLIDDSPIEITIKTASDDPEEETIEIDIKE